MMGPTHRLAGFLSGEVVALLTHQSWAWVPISGLVASASAHGWASPDIDQTAPWVAVRKRLPAPLAKVLNHRELAHWWGIPGLAAVASLQLAPDVRWLVTLLIA